MKTLILLLFLISTGCRAQNPNIQLINAFPNLTFTQPLHLTHSNDGTNRLFVVQQTGQIKVFQNDSTISSSGLKTFLDISNKISSSGGEQGFLGLAFHPSYSTNGYFFVDYTAPNPLRTVISRFKVSSNNPDKADSLSEYKILEILQPFTNHNGGTVMFGLDGFLYIGMGDGGSGGDPNNNAQNTQVLLGKMLRIDINDTSALKRYVIPPTNPYYGQPGIGKEEIFTLGMRNPWKYSQDPVTGLIYAGDVGQNAWEEIDIIQNGKNYGWRIMEGLACYNPPSGCDTTGLTKPIKVYNHNSGNCSVTGGFVYRGNRRPELQGAYIYGDYCTGMIWMLRYNNGNISSDSLLINFQTPVSSFGTDQFNELYTLGYSTGKIYRFNRSISSGIHNNPDELPDKFDLMQNYPNPFNPSTTIDYSILKMSKVKVVINDIIGRHVKTLVNTSQLAGNYKMIWNGTDDYGKSVPSGIYFYSLISENYKKAKRMLLVK